MGLCHHSIFPSKWSPVRARWYSAWFIASRNKYSSIFFTTIEIVTRETPMFILIQISKVSWCLFWQLKYSKDHTLDTLIVWKIVDMVFLLMKILHLYLYQTFLTMFWRQSLMITTSWWRHINDTWEFSMLNPSGPRLNIKMLSYQYSDSVVKDKMVSLTVLSLTWESPYLGKMVFILRRGPDAEMGISKDDCQYCGCWCSDSQSHPLPHT